MANVIDTLIYKLGMDNSEFKEKMDDSIEQTDELEDSFDGLEDTIQSATMAGTFFGNVLSKVFELAVGYIRDAVNQYQDYIERLRLIHRETNQSIEDYQKWAYAIEYAGGNVNSFTSTFERLSKQIRQAPFTHNSTFLRGLSELGVNVHNANGGIKSMSDLLLGLAGRLSRMSEGKALLLGQRLGLDDDTIRLLHEGRNAVQSYLDKTKEEGLIQKKNLEVYERLRKARIEVSKGWKEVGNTIGNIVIPVYIKLLESFIKMRDFITQDTNLLKHLGTVLAVLGGIIGGLVVALGVLKVGFLAFGGVLWALGIGAFIALIDDLFTYLEGGDSSIGYIIDKFKEWGSAIKDFLKPALQWVKDFWSGFVDFFASKIEWCINLWDRFMDKIRAIKWWFNIGKDALDAINASNAGSTETVINNNSTTHNDWRGSYWSTPAKSYQTFFDYEPQQTVINSEGWND